MVKRLLDVNELADRLKPSERVDALEAERDSLASSFREYRREHGQIEQLLGEVLAAVPRIQPVAPVYKPPKTRRVDTDIAVVVHITDAHHGAVQLASEIEGFGVFSPDLSRARHHGLISDVLEWVEMHRFGYSIPECRFAVTGDLISGDIHDELRVTNAFPAPRQAVEAGEILAKQAATVAPHFERVILDIITDDNHGRLTRKPQAKEGGVNNWMYVTASIAKILLSAHKNVTVNIWPMPQKVINVCGRRYLICHGHDVMGWGGFPYYGIERKTAREALKRMNGPDMTRFDKIIMGHWHAPLEHPYYWIGGSVSGTDAYDHKAGRQAEPQQVSWLVHPKWGEFDRTCWRLTKHDPSVDRP
jgi:hypothetical protein